MYIIEYVCVFFVRWCDDWPLRPNGVWQKMGIDFLCWKAVYVFVFVFLCAFVFVFVFVFERCDDWKPITWPAERGVALKGHQLPRARFVTRSLQSISTTPPQLLTQICHSAFWNNHLPRRAICFAIRSNLLLNISVALASRKIWMYVPLSEVCHAKQG